MLFNSIEFSIFFPVFFAIYWAINKYDVKFQNLLIVFASYFFYACWDWRFLSLICLSTVVDYWAGLSIFNNSLAKNKKKYLYISLLCNLGILAFFKYFDFFIDNFNQVFLIFGSQFNVTSLKYILPVGISFYTFQTLSYTIDIYKGRIEPTQNFVAFAGFVSFFPQLVAGPIERASNLLPQFFESRRFTYKRGIEGLKQILWGLFKKMVIADSCAPFVNMFFAEPSLYSGSLLFLGAVLFAFQIYCDFSGYSDIAIGVARLLGFNLNQNFAFPYFSRDMGEFWRRWHISLSTWFRDYVYIPLGGNRGKKIVVIRNVILVFLISGFWHGANWSFVIWGLVHSLLFLPLILLNRHRNNLNVIELNFSWKSFKELMNVGITFFLITLTWIFFRAENLSDASQYYDHLFSSSFFTITDFSNDSGAFVLVLLIFFLLVIEWLGRRSQYAIENINLPGGQFIRWIFYSFIIFFIGMFAHTSSTPFIYFQF